MEIGEGRLCLLWEEGGMDVETAVLGSVEETRGDKESE